jgi:hypothetical protein
LGRADGLLAAQAGLRCLAGSVEAGLLPLFRGRGRVLSTGLTWLGSLAGERRPALDRRGRGRAALQPTGGNGARS